MPKGSFVRRQAFQMRKAGTTSLADISCHNNSCAGKLLPCCWSRQSFYVKLISMKNIGVSFLWILLASPMFALIYCLIVAYNSGDYEDATKITHCGAPNFAMSVSEVTSVPKSSRNVWLCSVLLHVYPRIFQTSLNFHTYFKAMNKNQDLTSWIYIDW